MGYKEDIQINIDQLDAEWIKQAALYQHYARQEAEALYSRDQLADGLALVQAQLDGDIRLNFGTHGFESKPTEAAILNSIKQNPLYTKANILLMKASCKAKIIGGAVRSFDHKKKALEKLTDLYLSGYWSAPKIKSEAQEVYEKQIRGKIEADLKKEERLATKALKTDGTESTAGIKSEAIVAKKKAATLRKAPKEAAAFREKKKDAAGKKKAEPKPIGKTKEALLKQNRSTPSPRSSRKKK